ncbi:MAG: OsmC family protein [Saprospirales bacterium]|nr:OsmC family protein [Saprospirales bacterium]
MLGADEAGNEIRLSLPETAGGGGGLRPMQLMIMSLGGCAAVDVLVILKKQRQSVTGLHRMEAERFHLPFPAPGKKRTWSLPFPAK